MPSDPIATVATPDAPTPRGHYSQAVVHRGLVYVSGQLGAPAGPIEEQTERALRNVEAVLRAAGSGLDRLLSVTIFVSDQAHWGKVNEVFARVLGSHRPSRAVVPVKEFRDGLLVEIQAIAALNP